MKKRYALLCGGVSLIALSATLGIETIITFYTALASAIALIAINAAVRWSFMAVSQRLV